MNGNYQIGDVVFGNWVILGEIGKGSFGRVYTVGHQDDRSITAALKVITVPQDQAEIKMAADEGMDYQELSQHFYGMVQEIEKEFKLQFKVKGSGHVVAYEDHKVEMHKDQFGRELLGWDILIRMELLTPLLTWAYEHPMSRADIIRLGIHLCKALEACQIHGILHRDIKPENIFVSATGDYKLGDFGVARTMEKTVSNMSKKGTYNYMAPEVYKGLDCNFKADIYSVAIVLYRLLNRNRFPFLPPVPQQVTMRDREQALARRMKGERLPLPLYAQDRLGEIVCKAASYDPEERHASAAEMRRELEEALRFERDERAIYPDAEDLKKRQDVDRMSRTVNPSETPRMSDRTMHVNQMDGTAWGEDTMDDTADRTASGWGARGGFASQERTASDNAYFRPGSFVQSVEEEEPEEMTSSTVSAWSHKTPSGQAATMEDRKQAMAEEAHIAMNKAKSGAVSEALDSARKASREAKEAAKLAKQEREREKANRPARNEQEAKEAYERACREKNAKTTERETLENMAITDSVLKAEMMRDAAKAEMEAVVRVNETKRVWDEFRQKRQEEEEAARQAELKLKQEEARAEAERKRKKDEADRKRQEKQRKAEKKSFNRWKRRFFDQPGMKALTVFMGFVFLGFIACVIYGSVADGKNNSKDSEMASRVAVIADDYWDIFYDSLDVEGDLNYRTSSLEEIGQVLQDAGFQFWTDETGIRSDEVFICNHETGSTSITAESGEMLSDKYYQVAVWNYSSGKRSVAFEFDTSLYNDLQSKGEVPVFLPDEYTFGGTPAWEYGIYEDMIKWAQKHESHESLECGSWKVRAYGNYDGSEITFIMSNQEEDKDLMLVFKQAEGDNEYTLRKIDIEFPEDSGLAWERFAEEMSITVKEELNAVKEISLVHLKEDALEDIADGLSELGFYYLDENTSYTEVPTILLQEDGSRSMAAIWSYYDGDTGVDAFLSIMVKDKETENIRIIDLLNMSTSDIYELVEQEQAPYVLPKSFQLSKDTMEDIGITEEMFQLISKKSEIQGDNWFYSVRANENGEKVVRLKRMGDAHEALALAFSQEENQWILERMELSYSYGQEAEEGAE